MPYISRKDLIEASQAGSLAIMVRTSASLAARPIPLHALPVQRLPVSPPPSYLNRRGRYAPALAAFSRFTEQ
jgi:hypothetical protein